MNDIAFSYDGTWEGMLTMAFDVFATKTMPAHVLRHGDPPPMFADDCRYIDTDDTKAERVWNGLQRKMSATALSALTTAFLCELPEFDITMLRYLRKMFLQKRGIESDFNDPDVLEVTNMCRKVRHERLRILQFARFQKAADGTYFAIMEPLYNVLPIAIPHFRDRFADQQFLLYDRRRDYGYFYDGQRERIVTLPSALPHISTGRLPEQLMDENEMLFQRLWQTYFNAIAIKERTNPRKQRQDMPVRFWKYLTEKH